MYQLRIDLSAREVPSYPHEHRTAIAMNDHLSPSHDERADSYSLYGLKVQTLLEDLIGVANVQVLSIVHRIKSKPSTLAKVRRLQIGSSDVSALHDFLGVRVITYFSDHVDLVAEIINREFEVDHSRTKDKRSSIEPDRFGYLSLHFVARPSAARLALAEWAPFADMWFELQIRSALQHAWAEIEHDLGYKATGGSIPAQFRRRFSRVAGLLEIADQEFTSLREDLENYEIDVRASLERGEEAQLDQASMQAFMASNELVKRLDQYIAVGHGAKLEEATGVYARARVIEFQSLGISTTSEIAALLQEHSDSIVELAVEWLNDTSDLDLEDPDERDDRGRYLRLSSGISLFYLYLHLHALSGRVGEDGYSPFSDWDSARKFIALHSQIAARD